MILGLRVSRRVNSTLRCVSPYGLIGDGLLQYEKKRREKDNCDSIGLNGIEMGK